MAETLSGDEQFPVIARFEIRRRAYLAPDGTGLRRLPSFAYDIALLVSFYRAMVLARDVGIGRLMGRPSTSALAHRPAALSSPFRLKIIFTRPLLFLIFGR